MLAQAFLFGVLFIFGVQCNFYSDLEAIPDDPFTHSAAWNNWRSPPQTPYAWPYGPQSRSDNAEAASTNNREPLASDFQDPMGKPSLAKPDPTKPTKPSFNPSILPGGVLDVDASGLDAYPAADLPNFPEFQGNFGFGFGGGSSGESSRPGGGLFGLGGFFGPAGQPWWKGANVCIEREESTDDEEEVVSETEKNDTSTTERIPNFFQTAISLSNCHQTPNQYECVTKINNHGVFKTFTVRYKCCYGFERTEGSTGCNKQIELKTVSETIDKLEGQEFKKMISISGLEEDLENGNYTVFVPTDAALNDFNDMMTDMNTVESFRRRRDAVSDSELTRNHIVEGFVDLHYLSNEELINTENNNKTIRINIYPTQNFDKLVTANCARVKKFNNFAKNGIVHVVDSVIPSASQSIQDIIAENSKLTSLRQVLENSNLTSFFKDDGHYTIFAATDEAFDKLDDVTRFKLLNGNACAPSILRHHIVGHTVCSSAIIGNATTHNIEGEILNMERTSDNKLIIEETANIIKHDIIATNGVVHLIDTLIIPDTALYLNEALKRNNLTKFQELIKQAELEDDMDAFENSTVFAPSNAALESPESKLILDEIKDDKDKLREFIKYHTLKGQLESCNMENNAKLETEAGNTLRVNLYSTLPLFANIVNRATVNCARLTNYDEKSCGSIIHEIDRVIVPPSKTIMDIINNDSKYSTLIKIMNGTEIEKILSNEKESITFAAPDDNAFSTVDAVDLKTLMEDKEKATVVLKNHILTEILCCSGVGPQTFGFNNVIPTLSGQHQQISRSGSQQIRIGRATVNKCDTMATNGIIHTINRVLFPQRPHVPHFGGFFLFDL